MKSKMGRPRKAREDCRVGVSFSMLESERKIIAKAAGIASKEFGVKYCLSWTVLKAVEEFLERRKL